MNILKNKITFFDGAMGTMLQKAGLKNGEIPELWNVENSDAVINIHKQYIDAGCNILKANTFGANEFKIKNTKYTVEQIVSAGVKNAKSVANGQLVALDIGPLGKLLEPYGEVEEDEAYRIFKDMVVAGSKSGADLVLIETMYDLNEVSVAVKAAKENADLPVFVTMTFDANGRTMMGTDVKTVAKALDELNVDAMGMNCGLGPYQMKDLFLQMKASTNTPIIVNPNAGLPNVIDDKVVYDIDADEFAQAVAEIASGGACVVGGCCGTTPLHIRNLINKILL